jgi:hypothetical protein
MGQYQSSLSPKKITWIKLPHSRLIEWAPTTDKNEGHLNGAKAQR